MGYSEALEAAGCKVLNFEEFGSYQGTWLAFVKYNEETGIVEGSYGSCSGCDAFEGEFGLGDGPIESEGKYYKSYRTWDESEETTKEEYEQLLLKQKQKLADFGQTYLVGGLYGKEHYQNKLNNIKEDDWFDHETKEECEWAINQFKT